MQNRVDWKSMMSYPREHTFHMCIDQDVNPILVVKPPPGLR